MTGMLVYGYTSIMPGIHWLLHELISRSPRRNPVKDPLKDHDLDPVDPAPPAVFIPPAVSTFSSNWWHDPPGSGRWKPFIWGVSTQVQARSREEMRSLCFVIVLFWVGSFFLSLFRIGEATWSFCHQKTGTLETVQTDSTTTYKDHKGPPVDVRARCLEVKLDTTNTFWTGPFYLISWTLGAFFGTRNK